MGLLQNEFDPRQMNPGNTMPISNPSNSSTMPRDSSLNHHKFMQYSNADLMAMANSRNTAAPGQPASFDMTDLGLGPGTIQDGKLYFPKGSVTDNGNHARYITDNGQGGSGVNDVQNSNGWIQDHKKELWGAAALAAGGYGLSALGAFGGAGAAAGAATGGGAIGSAGTIGAGGAFTALGAEGLGSAAGVGAMGLGGALPAIAGGAGAGAFSALGAEGLGTAAGVAPMGAAGNLPNVAGSGLLGTANNLAQGVSAVKGVAGALSGNQQGGNMASGGTTTSQIDPRMNNILYGSNGNNGYLNNLIGSAKNQTPGMGLLGQSGDNYVGKFGANDLESMRSAGNNLMNSNIQSPTMQGAQSATSSSMTPGAMQAAQGQNTPAMQAAQMSAPGAMQAAQGNAVEMTGAQINSPSQNNMNLNNSFDSLINGQAGNNPYLTGAIQKGINQSNTAFQNMQTDATRNLTENVLGNIRGGAVAAGQYGSSRQGLAEGNAIKDFSTQMGRAASQYGQNNTDSAISAQSGAYDADRNRQLSATMGLSGSQYQNAQAQAQMDQQAAMQNAQSSNAMSMANLGYQNQANQTNYNGQMQVNQTNAGLLNQANQTNYQGNQQTGMANTGYQNQANQTNYQGQLNNGQFNANLGNSANQFNANSQNNASQNNGQWQQNNNQLNSSNQLNGISAAGNTLNNAANIAQNANQYNLNNQLKVGSGLSNFTGLNQTQTNTGPSSNNTQNWLGGATAIGGLLSAYNGWGK